MIRNYTPLKMDKVRDNNNVINTILLLMATLTTLVLVVLLFLLIQKKIKQSVTPSPTPISFPSPELTPTSSSSAKPSELIPVTSQSGQMLLTPTNTATKSSL